MPIRACPVSNYLAALTLVIGCSGKSDDAGSAGALSQPAQAALAEAPAPQPSVQTDCPATGLWAVCSLEKRLRQSGFVPQKSDSTVPRRPGFSRSPVAYTLNKSRLEVFIYEDTEALKGEIAKMDTAAAAPVFIRSVNMVALLFTDDATQAERLSLALTAGPPQSVR